LLNKDKFIDEILKIKKARLIEHNMTYEDLVQCKNFSDDEVTLAYTHAHVADLKNINLIKKTKMMKK
jgi:hypothetical protein